MVQACGALCPAAQRPSASIVPPQAVVVCDLWPICWGQHTQNEASFRKLIGETPRSIWLLQQNPISPHAKLLYASAQKGWCGAVELVRPVFVGGVRDRVPFTTEEDGALHYSQNPQDKRPSRAGVEFEFGDRSPAREDQLELLRLGVEVVSLRTH